MKSLKGHFLVASSHLADPNFVRTVILLVHHSDDGAFGVVLNRRPRTASPNFGRRLARARASASSRSTWGGPFPGPSWPSTAIRTWPR